MLASDAPILTLGGKQPRFWHLRISRDFDRPGYYIGQTVLHRMEVSQGEILHPVEVIGICWTGIDWEYAVEFPEEHPFFIQYDREADWVSEKHLEPM